MLVKQIFFTGKGKAELLDDEIGPLKKDEVLVETCFVPISAGTERANLLRMPNTPAFGLEDGVRGWGGGYSSAGIIKEIGEKVRNISVGDRVLTFWSQNRNFNIVPQSNVIKIPEGLKMEHAAFAFIASFSAAAIRKTRLEFGETAMIFGIGILGAFAVQLLRTAGAFPIIAADLNPNRRRLALELGADYAFDPSDLNFIQNVKNVTGDGNGPKVVIEATGQSVALKQALDCIAPLGRIALLGCTRISDTGIDFYQQVHKPGITIVGAHTDARPKTESYPYYWTQQDDCITMLNFMANGRLDMTKILSEVHSPKEAPEVYKRLAEDKDFPVGVVLNWTDIK